MPKNYNSVDAWKLIQHVVRELKRKYSDFIYPLSMLEWKEREYTSSQAERNWKLLSTDGLNIYYVPQEVNIGKVQQLERELIHILLHGFLGHFERNSEFSRKETAWAIMDMQVALVSNLLGITGESYQLKYINATVEGRYDFGLYYKALGDKRLGTNIVMLARRLKEDDHGEWERRADNTREKIAKLWGQARVCLGIEEDEKRDKGAGANCLKGDSLYKDIAVWAEEISGEVGGKGTDRESTFRLKEKRLRKYGDVLREMVSVREMVYEEPDSIDPMFYHYGMELYEDVPLIEPLEIVDKQTVNTIVIAVDVSGSCEQDDIMNKFWGETFDFVEQLKSKITWGKIILLQCDDKIQEEEAFLLEEFPVRPETKKVRGLGGTSFVPVFRRIRELQRAGERIDGLFYLTDGLGTYPKEQPDYPVYFVLPEKERGGMPFHKPEWISWLYLEK